MNKTALSRFILRTIMQITRIELINFRNHQHLVLDDLSRVLIIVGNNAVGKTNIIEALQLISMHESFRKPKGEELITRQRSREENTLISADILLLGSINTKQIIFNENNKTFFYNKKERPSKDIKHLLPSVLFTPDDLHIIKGPPEQRRELLDSLGSHLSRSFAQIKNEYTKTLRHKNSLLKQREIDKTLLDSWNCNIAKLGSSLYTHRLGLFEQLLESAAPLYSKISGGETLTGNYQASWCGDLSTALQEKMEEEIGAKRALIGPHKDDVSFCINAHDARRSASQGQQRSITLSLKMAEIELLRRVSGREPLLLLDDVMSELDALRRAHFMDIVNKASQTVITTTNLGYFDEEFLAHATVVELSKEGQAKV